VSLSSITPNGGFFNNQVMVFDALAFTLPTVVNDDDRVTAIVNDQTGKCLVPIELTGPVSVSQKTCTGSVDQQWIIRKTGLYDPLPSNPRILYYKYRFIHRTTGLCLAVRGNTVAEGAIAEARSCDDSAYMYWFNNELLNFPIDNQWLFSKPGMALRPQDNSSADLAFMKQETVDTSTGVPTDRFMMWDY
jgi:hypothetical protein